LNPATRLAEIISALDRLGILVLVMGGHAVRYYGIERNTVDYDLHVTQVNWDGLDEILKHDPFLAGRLPDGREEWLEFWRRNHLLAPFAEMYARREQGEYGGREISFLSLPDLIRSKETERESDWRDIELLEEIFDLRNLAHAHDENRLVRALSFLRSRRGFEAALAGGHLGQRNIPIEAAFEARNPISRAYLWPFSPSDQKAATETGLIGEIFAGPLRHVAAGSARHLALVEAIRRLYKQAAMAADRADKLRA